MFGSYIQAARERAQMSRSDLARAVGYSDGDMIGKIERDVANVSLSKLSQMADALNMPIGDLLPNSGANPTDDLFQPLLALMAGFAPGEMRELVNDLAVQARVTLKWRTRELHPSIEQLAASPALGTTKALLQQPATGSEGNNNHNNADPGSPRPRKPSGAVVHDRHRSGGAR